MQKSLADLQAARTVQAQQTADIAKCEFQAT
jgi:hypothetical protein